MLQENNSDSLRRRFSAVYQEFCLRHSLVVSCPVSFFVIGEHAVLSGCIAAKQTIPLRVYCGVRPSNDGQFRINPDVQEYWTSLQSFQRTRLHYGLTKGVHKRVLEILAPHVSNEACGLEIEFLSEAPLYSGLGTSGAMAAAAITAVFLQLRIITSEQVAGWSFPEPKHQGLDLVFRMAWYLEALVHEGGSSGISPYCALVGSRCMPILYSLQSKLPVQITDFRESKYAARRLADMVQERAEKEDWPLSFALIYTGDRQGPTGKIWKEIHDTKTDLVELRQFFQNDNDAIKELKRGSPALDQTSEELWTIYMQALSLASLDGVKLLIQIFTEDSGRERRIARFLEKVRFYQAVLRLMNLSTPTIESLVAWTSLRLPANHSAVKVSGAGRGGDVVVFLPLQHERDLCKVVDGFLAENENRKIIIDYIYERDGVESRGAVVELDANQGIFNSELLSEDSIVATKWIGATRSRRIFLSHQEASRLFSEFDLGLDQEHEKVFIRGQQHEKLKTQKQILKAIPILIERQGEAISAKQCGVTYDRQNAQSKIASALAFALRSVGKNIDFKCTGALNGPLKLELRLNGATVVLVQRLSSFLKAKSAARQV